VLGGTAVSLLSRWGAVIGENECSVHPPALMKTLTLVLLSAAALGLAAPARAVSLDEACARFASKLQTAVASGDTGKAQKVYTEGSKRVASHFNGATCPNVKAP